MINKIKILIDEYISLNKEKITFDTFNLFKNDITDIIYSVGDYKHQYSIFDDGNYSEYIKIIPTEILISELCIDNEKLFFYINQDYNSSFILLSKSEVDFEFEYMDFVLMCLNKNKIIYNRKKKIKKLLL